MSADFIAPSGWQRPDLGARGPGVYRLLRASHRGLLAQLHASLLDPEAAQRQALARVLAATRQSAFGAAHGLAAVHTLDALRAAVPVRDWDGLTPWTERVWAGETQAMLATPLERFVATSGTTGRPKRLPVTRAWSDEVARVQRLWVLAQLRSQPALSQGRVLAVTGPLQTERSPGGVPVGSNTGRMRARQPWWVRRRYALPADLHRIAELEVRQYALLRLALGQDVRSWTTANPSTVLMLARVAARHWEALCADVADGTLCRGPGADVPRAWVRRWRRASRALPQSPLLGRAWQLAALNCWTGGHTGFFLDRVPGVLGASPVIREAGISSSEGYFAVALHESWRGGLLWTPGHVLEGIDAGGTPHWPWEWELGRVYRLVISTSAGLVRYDLDDHLEVVGHWGRVPLVRFVGRGADTVSVTGEKLTAAQVAAAVRGQAGPALVGFVATAELAEVPTWVLHAEGADLDAAALDAALCRLNEEYASKRHSGRLAPLEVRRVSAGTFARWHQLRLRDGAAEGQVKLPVVVGPGELDLPGSGLT